MNELQKQITELSVVLKKVDPESVEEEPQDYSLLDIPDAELTPEQRKEKKRIRFLKNAKEGREKAKQKKKELQEQKERQMKLEEEERLKNPEQYLENLRKRKLDLLERKSKRQKNNAQSIGRSTVAKQKKMRALTDVEHEDAKEEMFGANDEDWDIYLAMQSGEDAESEMETSELSRIDELLQKFDPKVENQPEKSVEAPETDYQIYLTTERIRIPEVLFQPSLMGIEQMGLAEAIYHILNQFNEVQRASMVQNIFFTGGNVLFPNFDQRVANDVRMMRPIDSVVRVFTAKDAVKDAWRGASKWATTPEFSTSIITKAMYEEKGADYLKEHFASNVYYKSA